VQFSIPMLFRVIRVHDWSTYNGWAWLDGYELNRLGEAVERRSIFVQLAGLQSAQVDPMPNRYRTPRDYAKPTGSARTGSATARRS
jgi:hypothetical protein